MFIPNPRERSNPGRRHPLGALCFLVSLLLASSMVDTALAQAPPPSPVHVAPVQTETLRETQQFTGSLRAVSRAGVAALEEGQVLSVAVQEGESIKKGEVLTRLDDRRIRAQIAEKEASLQVAKARVVQQRAELLRASQDFDRSETLWQKSVVTSKEYDHAQADVAVAEAQVGAAEKVVGQIASELELLQVRLADLTVEAPFDGRVVERHVEPGEWIHQGDQVVTLVSSGSIEAWIEVPERFSQQARQLDRPIEVEIHSTGKRLVADRVELIPDVHARSRTFWLVAEIADASEELSPGMSIVAWLPTTELAKRLTVFKDAVVRDSVSSYVYKAVGLADGGYQAVRTPVSILFESGDKVAVAEGALAEGDRVVIEGNERLLPGAPVDILDKDRPSLVLAERVSDGPVEEN